MINQALIFLKPHVATHDDVVSFSIEFLSKAGISVLHTQEIDGTVIDSKGLIDKHYSVISNYAMSKDVSSLEFAPDSKNKFKQAFNIEIETAIAEGKLMSADTFIREFSLDVNELAERWENSELTKLTGGLYAAYFNEYDRYVLDGFYPVLRKKYTTQNSKIIIALAEFSDADMSWEIFREDIIGSTNPAQASTTSLRGYLYKFGSNTFNISLNSGDNAIHASASAFEAFIEKTIWLQEFTCDTDTLFTELQKTLSVSCKTLQKLAKENPIVKYKGESKSLIDCCELKGVTETVKVFTLLAKSKQLPGVMIKEAELTSA